MQRWCRGKESLGKVREAKGGPKGSLASVHRSSSRSDAQQPSVWAPTGCLQGILQETQGFLQEVYKLLQDDLPRVFEVMMEWWNGMGDCVGWRWSWWWLRGRGLGWRMGVWSRLVYGGLRTTKSQENELRGEWRLSELERGHGCGFRSCQDEEDGNRMMWSSVNKTNCLWLEPKTRTSLTYVNCAILNQWTTKLLGRAHTNSIMGIQDYLKKSHSSDTISISLWRRSYDAYGVYHA